jgi:hypothetical protein
MKSESRKTLANIALALVTLFGTALFWPNVGLTIGILFVAGLLMIWIEADKATPVIYIVAFIAGALSEALVINVGSAWQYTSPQILGIPV